MAKLILHSPAQPAEKRTREREKRFQQLTPPEKWNELLALIRLAVAMNGGRPLKLPRGKGVVIHRTVSLHDC